MGCGTSVLSGAFTTGAQPIPSLTPTWKDDGGPTSQMPNAKAAIHQLFRAGGSPSKKAGAQGPMCDAPGFSRYVRLITSLPFKRTAAFEELLVRCCLPRVREHCRARGWSLLAISITDEADPELANSGADTISLCLLELDRCLRLSGGPAVLAILDRSLILEKPLPPPSLTAAEYTKLLDYFQDKGDSDVSLQQGGALLRKWYRQPTLAGQRTPSGTKNGAWKEDYRLVTPADYLDARNSVFSPMAAGHGLSRQDRRRAAGAELARLGSVLSSAALLALASVHANAAIGGSELKLGGEEGRMYSRDAAMTAAEGAFEGDLCSTREGEHEEDGDRERLTLITAPLQPDLRGLLVAGHRKVPAESPSAHLGEQPQPGDPIAPVLAERQTAGQTSGLAMQGQDIRVMHLKDLDSSLTPAQLTDSISGETKVRALWHEPGSGGTDSGNEEWVGREPQLAEAEDLDAAVPVVYDEEGKADERKGLGGLFKTRASGSACASDVLHKYEGSVAERLLHYCARRKVVNSGAVISVAPPRGLFMPPPPLNRAREVVMEAVSWESSSVTEYANLSRVLHDSSQEQLHASKQVHIPALVDVGAAISSLWGKRLLGGEAAGRGPLYLQDTGKTGNLTQFARSGQEAEAPGNKGRDAEPERRLPRATRKQLHELEMLHERHDAAAVVERSGENEAAEGEEGDTIQPAPPVVADKNAVTDEKDDGYEKTAGSDAGHDGRGFHPKGQNMRLHIEKLQIHGLSAKAGTNLRLEVFVARTTGAEAFKAALGKKLILTNGTIEWSHLTELAVTPELLDEGMLHLRLVEPRLLGEAQCVGTAAVVLCEVARHEDLEVNPAVHQAWTSLLGAGEFDTADGDIDGDGQEASMCVVMRVSASDSAVARMEKGRLAVNNRQFGTAVRLFQEASAKFLELRNTRMAAEALALIEESKRRQTQTQPQSMRRVELMRRYLALPSLPDHPPSSLSHVEWGGGIDPQEEEAIMAELQNSACVVDFGGGQDWLLEEVADELNGTKKHAVLRMPPGEVQALEAVSQTQAMLPSALATAMDTVTEALIRAIDAQTVSTATPDDSAGTNSSGRPHDGGGDDGWPAWLGPVAAEGQVTGCFGEDPLRFELRCHAHQQQRHIVQDFSPEKDVDDVCRYLLEKPSLSRPVFVLEGVGHGVGVSAVMANVVKRLQATSEERKLNLRIITRFIGATASSRHLTPLLHSIALELQGHIQLDAAVRNGHGAHGQGGGLQRLLQQPSPWFARLRAKASVAGGVGELHTQLRDLLALASAATPLVLVLDGLDQVLDACLEPLWLPAAGSMAAGEQVEPRDGANVMASHVLARLLGWLPLTTAPTRKGHDPLLPPYVRVVVTHHGDAPRLNEALQLLMTRKACTKTLRGISIEEKPRIAAILRVLNARDGRRVPDGVLLNTLLPPLVPATPAGHARGATAKGLTVTCESLALSLAMKRQAMSKGIKVPAPAPLGAGPSQSGVDATTHTGLLQHGPADDEPAFEAAFASTEQLCDACFGHLAQNVGRGLLKRLLGLLWSCEDGCGAGLAEDELCDCLVLATPRSLQQERAAKQPAAAVDGGRAGVREEWKGANAVSVGGAVWADGGGPQKEPSADNWEGGGKGVESCSHLEVLRTVEYLHDAGILRAQPTADGTRVLVLSSPLVRQQAARFAFGHSMSDTTQGSRTTATHSTPNRACVGAHAVLAAYWMGRHAPPDWCGLPASHPLHAVCTTAHSMLMRNPLFPSQPWFWDSSGSREAGAEPVRSTDDEGKEAALNHEPHAPGDRVYNVRKMQQVARQLLGAGLVEAAQGLLTDLEYLTLKLEAGRIHELFEEYEALRVAMRARGGGESCFLDATSQFERFLVQSQGLYMRAPHVLFQTAANAHEDSPLGRAALKTLSLSRAHPPWLLWVNSPRGPDVAACWTLQAHQERVVAIAVSRDAAWLATAATDRMCHLWELSSGIARQTLPRAAATTSVLLWSPDSHYLAVGDVDGGVKLWHRVRGGESSSVAEFGVTAHAGMVNALAFAQGAGAGDQMGGRGVGSETAAILLLTGGADGNVKVWSTATSSVVCVLREHQGAVHNLFVRMPPSPQAGSAVMARLVSQRLEARRRLIASRKSPHKARLPPLAGEPGGMTGAAALMQLHPGEDSTAVAHVLSCGADGRIVESQVRSGRRLRTFEGHSAAVVCVDVTEEMQLLVSASLDLTCVLWRLADGSPVAVIQHDAPMASVMFDVKSDLIVSICREGLLRLWDLHTLERMGKTDAIGLQGLSPGPQSDELRQACTMAKDTGMLFVGNLSGCVRAFTSAPSEFPAHSKVDLPGLATSGAINGDQSWVARAGLSGNSLPSGDGTGRVTAICVGEAVMCTGCSDGELAGWNMRTGDVLWRLSSGQRSVTALAFEGSHIQLLASASSVGEVLFWDVGHARVSVPVAALAAHAHSISCVAFSPCSSLFLTASVDKTLRVWSLVGKPGDRHNTAANSLVRDGQLAKGHDGDEEEQCRGLRIRALHRLVGHDEPVTSAAFVPYGVGGHTTVNKVAGIAGAQLLASCSTDASVRLWNLATGEALQTLLRPLGRPVSLAAVAWPPDARHVAAGGADGSIRIWSLADIDARSRSKGERGHAQNRAEILVLQARGALEVLTESLRKLGTDALEHLSMLALPGEKDCQGGEARRCERNGAWMVPDALRPRVVDGHRAPVTCVRYTLSGSFLVSACAGGQVKVWDSSRGALVRTLIRCREGVGVLDLALTTDPGDRAWVACADGFVRGARLPEREMELLAVQAKSGAVEALGLTEEALVLHGTNVDEGGSGNGHERQLPAKKRKSRTRVSEKSEQELEEEKNADVLANAAVALERVGMSRVGDALKGVPLVRVGGLQVFGSGLAVVAVAHSQEVAASVSKGSKTIELRDPCSLTVRAHLRGHRDSVSSLCMESGGGWLVSGSADGTVNLWEAAAARYRMTQPCFRQGVSAVAIQRAAEIAAAGSLLGDIQVLDFRSAAIVTQFTESEAQLSGLWFANEARLLVFAHHDGVLGVRDLRQSKSVLVRHTSTSRTAAIPAREAAAIAAEAVELVEDHEGVLPHTSLPVAAGAGPAPGHVTSSTNKTGRFLSRVLFGSAPSKKPPPLTRAMCCSPDGRLLARSCDSVVEVYDMRQPATPVYTDTTHSGVVTALTMLDNGCAVASAGEDCLIKIWSVPGRQSTWGSKVASWESLRGGLAHSPELYGDAIRGRAQGSSSVLFHSRQAVTALGGHETSLFAAGDASGRFYALSLQPGKLNGRQY